MMFIPWPALYSESATLLTLLLAALFPIDEARQRHDLKQKKPRLPLPDSWEKAEGKHGAKRNALKNNQQRSITLSFVHLLPNIDSLYKIHVFMSSYFSPSKDMGKFHTLGFSCLFDRKNRRI